MKTTLIIIASIIVVILLGWLVSFIPFTPSPVATSTPPSATSTLPHCSTDTIYDVEAAKEMAKKGWTTYAVVSDCKELH